MAALDDVLERLVTDEAFRARLATDPEVALAGYDLSDDDRALLSSQMSGDAGRSGSVERRASKAGLFGLLGGLDEIADAIAGADGAQVTGAADDGHEIEMDVHVGKSEPPPPDELTARTAPAANDGHDREIEIDSFSWGARVTGPAGASGEGGAMASASAEPEAAPKHQGKVEYSWKIEEGVKVDETSDALAGHPAAQASDPDGAGRVKPQFGWNSEEGAGAEAAGGSGVSSTNSKEFTDAWSEAINPEGPPDALVAPDGNAPAEGGQHAESDFDFVAEPAERAAPAGDGTERAEPNA